VSPTCESRGTKWHVEVLKDDRRTPNTVGVFLVQSPLTREELAPRQKRLQVEFFTKCQRTGEWTTDSEKKFDQIFTESEDNIGFNDYFEKSWDLVKDDRTLVDAAGDIELKVKATVELVEFLEQESL
jgi:hypothetical protein